jgi:glutathione S-transferase
MPEVILHHYGVSLFSEKIRRILAYKGIPWRAVEQPMMAPKPDLTPLTGGYRRIPVLQVGADIYCDTECIARRLEQLQPQPACYPKEQAALAETLEDWADHRFVSLITPAAIVEMLPNLPPGILEDRAAMSPLLSRENLIARAPHAWSQALLAMDRLNEQLRERAFLLGDRFSVADAACYHPIWFMKHAPKLFKELEARPALAAWYARIKAFGPGNVQPMSPAEALEIARAAEPVDIEGNSIDVSGLASGDAVGITADDYGRETVFGMVVRLTADEITVRREDPKLGALAVHFPRAGYRVAKQ